MFFYMYCFIHFPYLLYPHVGPICQRPPWKARHPFIPSIHLHLQSIPPNSHILGLWERYPRRKHACTWRTCKPGTKRPEPNFEPQTLPLQTLTRYPKMLCDVWPLEGSERPWTLFIAGSWWGRVPERRGFLFSSDPTRWPGTPAETQHSDKEGDYISESLLKVCPHTQSYN